MVLFNKINVIFSIRFLLVCKVLLILYINVQSSRHFQNLSIIFNYMSADDFGFSMQTIISSTIFKYLFFRKARYFSETQNFHHFPLDAKHEMVKKLIFEDSVHSQLFIKPWTMTLLLVYPRNTFNLSCFPTI